MRLSTRNYVLHAMPRLVTAALGLLLISAAVLAQDATFTVTVGAKSDGHPNPGGTIGAAYLIDDVEGQELRLQRGATYTFQMQGVSAIHPFYLSTSQIGGGAEVYDDGVTGTFATGDEALTFTVPEDAPSLLYYQCGSHMFMGWRIYVTDATPDPVALELVADGLTSPVVMAVPSDDSGRLFIADQTGLVRIITSEGELLATPFLDVQDRLVSLNDGYDERGFLGLAFHPNYATNGRFYVYYSAPLRDEAPDDFNHTAHVAEFTVSSDPNVADPASERLILQVDEPQGNHNGGTLGFSPDDGFLYVSLGDGGGANDVGTGHVADWYDVNEGGNGQNVTESLLGTILRLDVDGGDPYGIPADNPFVGRDGRDEIYAYGFRNPWRFSFDQGGAHDLLVGDAGQNLWEEVSRVTNGGNYGWNVNEGTHCFSTETPGTSLPTCPDEVGSGHPDEGAALVDPVIEYAHPGLPGGFGLVVVAGQVYRGSRLPELAGRYVFADWSDSFQSPSGQLLIATPNEEGLWAFEPLPVTDAPDGILDHYVLAFGQDADGEVYVLTTDTPGPTGETGAVYRLGPASDTAAEAPAAPEALVLEPGFPNPFRAATSLRFRLATSDHVTVRVLDVLGRHVATLTDAVLPAGPHTVAWDATNEAGSPTPSGVYLVQVTAGERTAGRAVTLVR